MRISRAYDDLGRLETLSSYDNATVGQGSVGNQVLYAYNGWGRLAQEYQEHDGAVNPYGDALYVSYDYADGAGVGS
jgi:hypothetical protein